MKEFWIMMAVSTAVAAAYEGIKRVTPIQRKLNEITLRKHHTAAVAQEMQMAVIGLMDAEEKCAERLNVEVV